MNHLVDTYLSDGCGRCSLGGTPDCKVHRWHEELVLLREMLLHCGLNEELKWSIPCYTYQNSNIVLLSAFKEYCALSFFKGSLLRDSNGMLIQQTENVQATRQLRFTNVQEIADLETVIRSYIYEAIEVEKLGLKVDMKDRAELAYPEELELKLADDAAFKAAFEALTPGRQRGYVLFFAAPKQSKTRAERIEKNRAQILEGKGLHDDYRSNKK
ncbi:MAG: DUF1801 domain-containing protein [Flavobacteriales bacterium]|nr:DUF1801 domain-containing protein [Flavobacteriales bacterium]